MNKKKIITIISILAVVILGIKGKSLLNERKDEIKNEPTPKVANITVPVVKAKNGILSSSFSYLAKLQADKSIKLSTKLAGFVKKVYVSESDVVKKGDLLVEIDATELNSNISSVKASLQAVKRDYLLAKTIYRTNVKLYKVGGLPKEKLDLSKVALQMKEANLESTKQKLKSLENQLTYLTIKAPFDAKVDNVFLHEGDLAVTGKPIVSISNDSQKLIFSYAPTKSIMIKKHQKVFYNSKEIGEIKSIYNTSSNGLVTVEAKLTKRLDMPIGSSVNIDILGSKKDGCILPDATILHKSNANYILVYKDKKFVPQKVDILLRDKIHVLIKPCTKLPVASANETKLSSLPAYNQVNIVGADDE